MSVDQTEPQLEFDMEMNKLIRLMRIAKDISDEKEIVQNMINAVHKKIDSMYKIDRQPTQLAKFKQSSQNRKLLIKDLSKYVLNFQSGTYHWISDCRPRSLIKLKPEFSCEFQFRLHDLSPQIGIFHDELEWFDIDDNDKCFLVLDNEDNKIFIKVKIMKLVNI